MSFPNAVRHNGGTPLPLEAEEKLKGSDDAAFLGDKGMKDAIEKRNEAFRVLVQTVKLIAERIEGIQDRIIRI